MNVDVVIQTWSRTIKRFELFKATIRALKKHLCYDADNTTLTYYAVAEYHRSIMHEEMEKFCDSHNVKLIWKKTQPSLSSSLNQCQATGDAPLILFSQDDFQLQESINLDTLINHLESHKKDYVIRLNWKDQFKDHAKQSDTKGLLYLDPYQKAYFFCDWPHIRRREYMELLGPWDDSMRKDKDGKWFDDAKCENSQHGKAIKAAKKELAYVLVTDKRHFKHLGGKHTTLTQKKWGKK